jgi:hypothetical protein
MAWGAICISSPIASPHVLEGPNDADLFRAVGERVRDGESYYPTFAQELQARGYPTGSVFNFRLPTLTLMLVSVGAAAGVLIVSLIGVVTALLWLRHVRPTTPAAWLVTMSSVLATLPVWVWIASSPLQLHDLWAGQLIARSLALRAHGRAGLSVATALAAAGIRELALVCLVTMAVLSVVEGRRREAGLWIAATVTCLAFYAWHWLHVLPVIPAQARAYGWLRWNGWCFVLRTARVNVLVMLAPTWLVGLAVPLVWAGLWMRHSPVPRGVATIVTAYFLLFLAVGRPDTWYWGLLVAPLLPLGAIGWLSVPRGVRSTLRR